MKGGELYIVGTESRLKRGKLLFMKRVYQQIDSILNGLGFAASSTLAIAILAVLFVNQRLTLELIKFLVKGDGVVTIVEYTLLLPSMILAILCLIIEILILIRLNEK